MNLPDPSDFLVFVDESGDQNLVSINPQYPRTSKLSISATILPSCMNTTSCAEKNGFPDLMNRNAKR